MEKPYLLNTSIDSDSTSPNSPLLPRTHPQPEPSPLPAHLPLLPRHYPYILHPLLFLPTLTLLLTSLHLHTHPSLTNCLHLTSSPSPALPSITHHHLQFPTPHNISSSPYVGPSLAVDLHWGRVNFGDQMISASELALLHKDPERSMPATDPVTGEKGYRIGLEVFHQLHCLNMVRKATYPDYEDAYAGGDFGVGREELRGHLDHCIEVLRWNLMCHADVGVITFKPVEDVEGARRRGEVEWEPDFGSWHVCRDYEKVREWAVGRVVATDPV